MRLPDALADLDRKVLGPPSSEALPEQRRRPVAPPPRQLVIGTALAGLSWVLLAIWPSMSWHPLPGAATEAVLAVGVFSRRRMLLWILVLVVVLKAAIDVAGFTYGYVTMPILLLGVDLAALALLTLRRSRRWVKRPAPTLEDTYAYQEWTPPGAEFFIEWTPGVSDWDVVMRAKLWADRRTQLRWAIAGTFAVMSGLTVLGGDVLSLAFFIFFLGWASGVWDRLVRRRNLRRRLQHALEPEIVRITTDGVGVQTADLSFDSAWTRWKACLVLTDFVVLLTNAKEKGGDIMPLPRRGVRGTDSWDDVVRLVLSYVPPHPRADRVMARVPW